MTGYPFVRASRLSDPLECALRRILRKEKLAHHDLETEPVHDLRVAMRRCRSLAEGLSEMDPRPVWRNLAKASKKQQGEIAELRDSQVLCEWVVRLGLGREPAGKELRTNLEREEVRLRKKARGFLKKFPRKTWKRWLHALPAEAGELAVGEARLVKICFDRVNKVCALERRWRRGPSTVAWHRLRIGVKRFRYALESFMPVQHQTWGEELKRFQDLLGDGHDLDVLRERVTRFARGESLPLPVRDRWLKKIGRVRSKKTEQYTRAVQLPATARRRNPAGGRKAGERVPEPKFLWDLWREELGVRAKVNLTDAVERVP